MGIAMAVATCGAFTAFADPEAKAADLTGHTYTAYQIFSGTQADDETEGKLGDIEWGNGINSTAFLAALKADGTIGTVFTSCNTAADVAEAMKDWADMSDNAKAFAKLAEANKAGSGVPVVNGQTVLDAGYYIVVDTTDTTVTDGQVDAVKNVALLQLTKKGTFEIQNKTDVPEVEKKIGDANDTEAAAITDPAAVTDWRDSADHDVNNVIPYKITGTLPTNYADYDTYKYVFTDTMTAGLTYNADAKVYAVNGSTKTEITSAASILPTEAAAGAKLTVSFADLKAVTGVTIDSTTKIVVEYTCTLNENAKIGVEGNPNTVNLTYSNNPNSGGESETGKTPDDTVIAFTYKVTVN